MKTRLITFLYITILSVLMTNKICAENKIEMRTPFENLQEKSEITFLSANIQQPNSPFQTRSVSIQQKTFGNRPGSGDGIGQVAVSDGWWIVVIMVAGYCIEIGYRVYCKQKTTKAKKQE